VPICRLVSGATACHPHGQQDHLREGTMQLRRRHFLQLAASAAALPVLPRIARADPYPTRTVRLIVPVAPGGALDILARLIAQWLGEHMGQSFIVENRPGGGTNIGVDVVAHAQPDGYTLLLIPQSVTTNATLYKELNFNFIRDIVPIAMISRLPLVMEINNDIPAKTVPEFVAWVKKNPGKVSMASGGSGSASHVGGELFKMMTGIEMVHVPYRGGAPALTDLMGGQVQVMFSPLPESIGAIRGGKVRALAVTIAERSQALPDVPTVAESIPGFEASTWQGIGAPKGTPPEIVEKLNKEINAALVDPKIKTRLDELGSIPTPMSPDAYARLIADETEKWGKVIRDAHITLQ
jgi:tripartite-type tricarboxylate transporter receptor subunit TctC